MNDALIFDIVLSKSLNVQTAWLKERNKKLKIRRTVNFVKKMIIVYKMIKNRGQKTFDFS
ncbi:hypothetical protein [Sulfurovum sp.]|uniref:hypothetical protein n=1 Tax=Sulfurovum sp. TaxID=1969726 RepID=UPI0028680A85|nr:hypothetical protein [Sulfurovum sp.]